MTIISYEYVSHTFRQPSAFLQGAFGENLRSCNVLAAPGENSALDWRIIGHLLQLSAPCHIPSGALEKTYNHVYFGPLSQIMWLMFKSDDKFQLLLYVAVFYPSEVYYNCSQLIHLHTVTAIVPLRRLHTQGSPRHITNTIKKTTSRYGTMDFPGCWSKLNQIVNALTACG